MKTVTAVALGTAALPAYAHVADQPLLQHAIEHGWTWLALLPLVLLMLPLHRRRR